MLEKFRATATQIGQIIVGKPLQIRQSLTCLLAGGHLLIEDAPGVGKTTMAHAIAVSMGLHSVHQRSVAFRCRRRIGV